MTNNNIFAIFLEILQIFLEIVLNIILEEMVVRHVGYFLRKAMGMQGETIQSYHHQSYHRPQV